MTIALILSDLWRGGELLKTPFPPGPRTPKGPGEIGLIKHITMKNKGFYSKAGYVLGREISVFRPAAIMNTMTPMMNLEKKQFVEK